MTRTELTRRYNDGDRDFSGADLSWSTLRESTLIGATLIRANLRGSNLSGANLIGATLSGANLRGSDLRRANLRGANLTNSDLTGATLSGANLSWAKLSGANLRGSTLIGSNLRGAKLTGANLTGATLIKAEIKDVKWPSPTMVLLAAWGKVSDDLTRDLMRLEAACHPNPAAFDRWVDGGGPCPYDDVNVQRAANFAERKECWKPGRPPKIYNLMCRVLEEKCVLGG